MVEEKSAQNKESRRPPHIPADDCAPRKRARISRHFIFMGMLAAAIAFVVSVAYAVFGPPRSSFVRESRVVERVSDAFTERQILDAQTIALTIFAQHKNIRTQIIEEKDVLGYATVLTSDGWLIAPAEAVKNRQAVVFARPHGEKRIEKIVFDPASPVAFVKIAAENLAVSNFGSIGSLPRGERLLVITPAGAMPITLKDRMQCVADACPWEYGDRVSFAATSVEIIPSSLVGAPVVNHKGEVVGVVAMFDSSAVILPVEPMEQLFQSVFVNNIAVRPVLTVRAVNVVSVPVVDRIGKLPEQGFLIQPIGARSGAHYVASKGDFKDGDVIIRIGNVPVESETNLFDLVSKFGPQEVVKLTIARAGKTFEIEVKLGEIRGSK